MSKLREIKKRIKSVNNISQVTNAMQLVAASRMRKAQDNASRGKQYADRIRQMMIRLTLNETVMEDPFVDPHYSTSDSVLLVIFSPQRGLAGPLPGNLLRYVAHFSDELQAEGKSIKMVTVGQKLRSSLIRLDGELIADFSEMPEQPTTADLRPLIKLIMEGYQEQQFGKVYVVYPAFINAMTQTPTARLLLPLDIKGLMLSHEVENPHDQAEEFTQYEFEPSQEEILSELVPGYIETQLYQTRLETIASEYSARMIAMKSATDNAKEIKGDLTISYNKSRQAQITRELSEINAARVNKN